MRARNRGCEQDCLPRRCGEILKRAILENHPAAGDLSGTTPACCSVENDVAKHNDRSTWLDSKTTGGWVYDAPAIQLVRNIGTIGQSIGPGIQAANCTSNSSGAYSNGDVPAWRRKRA